MLQSLKTKGGEIGLTKKRMKPLREPPSNIRLKEILGNYAFCYQICSFDVVMGVILDFPILETIELQQDLKSRNEEMAKPTV